LPTARDLQTALALVVIRFTAPFLFFPFLVTFVFLLRQIVHLQTILPIRFSLTHPAQTYLQKHPSHPALQILMDLPGYVEYRRLFPLLLTLHFRVERVLPVKPVLILALHLGALFLLMLVALDFTQSSSM
jgi:hypothetical protein